MACSKDGRWKMWLIVNWDGKRQAIESRRRIMLEMAEPYEEESDSGHV